MAQIQQTLTLSPARQSHLLIVSKFLPGTTDATIIDSLYVKRITWCLSFLQNFLSQITSRWLRWLKTISNILSSISSKFIIYVSYALPKSTIGNLQVLQCLWLAFQCCHLIIILPVGKFWSCRSLE